MTAVSLCWGLSDPMTVMRSGQPCVRTSAEVWRICMTHSNCLALMSGNWMAESSTRGDSSKVWSRGWSGRAGE